MFPIHKSTRRVWETEPVSFLRNGERIEEVLKARFIGESRTPFQLVMSRVDYTKMQRSHITVKALSKGAEYAEAYFEWDNDQWVVTKKSWSSEADEERLEDAMIEFAEREFAKYAPGQPHDTRGRFSTSASSASALAPSFKVPTDDPSVYQGSLVSASKPYVGLSDKAQTVAKDIAPTQFIEQDETQKVIHATYKGEYDIRATFTEPMEEYDPKQIAILASDKNGNEVASMVVDSWDTKPYYVISHIDTSVRGVNMGTAMLEFARREAQLPIFHSTELSESGQHFAEVTKYAPGQPHDARGRFASGGVATMPNPISDPRGWIREVPINADAIFMYNDDQIAHHTFQRDAGIYDGSPELGDKARDYSTAVMEYTLPATYEEMQYDAREGKSNGYVDDLDSLIELAPALPHGLMAYRGIAPGAIADKIRAMPVGSVIENKGFTSVTPDYNVASSFQYQVGTTGMSDFSQKGGLTMSVIVPKGTKGLDVLGWGYKVDKKFLDNFSVGEEEWILPRNTKLQVVENLGYQITVAVVNG